MTTWSRCSYKTVVGLEREPVSLALERNVDGKIGMTDIEGKKFRYFFPEIWGNQGCITRLYSIHICILGQSTS